MTAPAMRPMTRAECEAEIARLEEQGRMCDVEASRHERARSRFWRGEAVSRRSLAAKYRATAAHYRATLGELPDA